MTNVLVHLVQRLLTVTGGKLAQTKGIPDAIAVSVLGSGNLSEVITELDNHTVDSAVDENHVFTLIKCISKSYSKIRFHHLGKETTASLQDRKIRKRLNKFVIFHH